MQKGNTLLYHGHIIQSIDTLDKRKDGYVQHRLQFLNKYCIPIRHKIEAIEADVKFYENMRDTAYEVIQSQSDIMQLKKEIADYKETNKYYQQKLDEFDLFKAQLQVYIKNRRKVLFQKREQCKTMFHDNDDNFDSFDFRIKLKKREKSKIFNLSNKSEEPQQNYTQQKQTLNYKDSLKNSNATIAINNSTLSQNQKLPEIHSKRGGKYSYIWDQQKQLSRHFRNQNRLQKIIKESEHYKSVSNSTISNPQTIELSDANTIRNIKHIVAQFDHTQALFRECFEHKKLIVQKSVTQLQSKLISNKQLFLHACEIIGQREGFMPFQDFCQLTSDQLTTLFISFGWLSKKVYNELAEKRKNIMLILKAVKMINQQK